MKIFLAWSGPRAKFVAEALVEFFHKVNKRYDTWLSHADILAGSQWRRDLRTAIKIADIGVLCITKASRQNPWIAFEGGALTAKQRRLICPYLIDLEIVEPTNPLAIFQSRKATESETWSLLVDINRLDKKPLERSEMRRRFTQYWPSLEKLFQNAPKEESPQVFNRLDSKGLDSLLEIYFRASVDKLVHALELLIVDPAKLNRRLLRTSIDSVVLEGRTLLAPFTSDKIGVLSAFLEEQLPLAKLHKILNDAIPKMAGIKTRAELHQAIYNVISNEQTKLREHIARRISNSHEQS